jgi:HlyD family secretion protein
LKTREKHALPIVTSSHLRYRLTFGESKLNRVIGSSRDRSSRSSKRPRAPILDPRQQTEASARVATARAIVAQSEATANQAVAERERLARLVEAGAAPRAMLDQAAAEETSMLAARNAARTELNAAQEALRRATETPGRAVQDVLRAPAPGRVLTVVRRDGAVNPGEPLIEVGDTERLEVVVDVLSQDAVRILEGTRVLLEQWGGDAPLEAIVRHVEPEAVSKVSALGVEERRVNVVADPVKPFPATVGPGYRVLARFVIWEEDNVLQVPSSALFRHDEGWAVFVIDSDRAVIRPVVIGQQAGLAAQVLSGLGEGDVVIVHPPNEIEAGVRVRPM